MTRMAVFFILMIQSVWAVEQVSPPPSTDSVPSGTAGEAGAGVTGEKKRDEPVIGEEMMKMRDPFRMPESLNAVSDVPKTDLERYSVEEFRLLGVLTGPSRLRAMLICPNGKTYFVAENMKIGPHRGVIRKITPNSIQIREKVINVLGQQEDVEREIRLPSENSLGEMKGALSSH